MEDLAPRQQAFDDLVTAVLARFASATGPEIDEQIHTSLREIAQFVGVDYAFVVQISPDLTAWSATHEWRAPGIPSHLEDYQNVPMGTVDWCERVVLAGEVVRVNSLEDTPPEAAAERERWESLGFKSTLHLPLRGQGGLVNGCVALSSILREVVWAQVDVQRLKLVGEAIANALERKRSEQEVRESESRFRVTFEQAPVGILNLALDGTLLKANQRFCDMLGYSPEETLGRHVRDFTHVDDRQASATVYEHLLAGRVAVQSLENRYLRKDGGIVWGNTTLSLVCDRAGEPQAFVAAIEDATARKQAEETFDGLPDLIFVLDRQHRIVRVNRAAAERLGRSRESLLGRYCYEVVRGTPASPESCFHTGMLADGKADQFEVHEPGLGGDFLVTCTPLRDARGEVTGLVHVARDVTELRRSETELRRAHEELKQRRALVVAASLDGVWEWDLASDAVQYSDRFAELLGYSPEEVPGTLDFFRSVLHPDDAEGLWAAVNRHLKEGAPYDVEFRLRTRSGSYRWFRSRGQAQRGSTNQAIWMAGSLQDVHDRKMAETELREALQEVERLTDRLRAENVYLQEEIASSQGFDEIVGESEPLRSTLTRIEHVADTDASVLLLGETGTGKELLARAIHNHSRRKDCPLVKVNLAALPSSLIESELFGHVKGAFTGAVSDKVGRFELADGGTLFLDEIGELDPELQTKLLRVLQEGEFERIGSGETLRADVRLVAATNRDLHRAMGQGKFRPDLYYRLAVFPIEVPPLRLRREDIPLLVWHFISKKQVRLGKTINSVPKTVMSALVEYDWPGNVRELENVVERAMILSSGSALTLEESFRPAPQHVPTALPASPPDVDRGRIVRVLDECHWKIKGAGNAADRLGLKPSTLRYRMKILGIKRPRVERQRLG
jgi:formate hydrogenlyase transcriptional activator